MEINVQNCIYLSPKKLPKVIVTTCNYVKENCNSFFAQFTITLKVKLFKIRID